MSQQRIPGNLWDLHRLFFAAQNASLVIFGSLMAFDIGLRFFVIDVQKNLIGFNRIIRYI
jgi:hypothetical protein